MFPWLSQIKAIGWDVDGTLYHPNTIPSGLIRERQIKALVDTNGWDPRHARSELERMYEQLGSYTKALTALGVAGERFFVDTWDNLALGEYIHHDQKLVETFEKLSGYHHFVISNSNRRDQIERKLTLLGLQPTLFRFIVSSVEVGEVKPDARPFMAALERLGPDFQTHPDTVLYVGDRLTTDVMGAHRVGMKAAYVWGTCEVADISCESVYRISDVLIEA